MDCTYKVWDLKEASKPKMLGSFQDHLGGVTILKANDHLMASYSQQDHLICIREIETLQ